MSLFKSLKTTTDNLLFVESKELEKSDMMSSSNIYKYSPDQIIIKEHVKIRVYSVDIKDDEIWYELNGLQHIDGEMNWFREDEIDDKLIHYYAENERYYDPILMNEYLRRIHVAVANIAKEEMNKNKIKETLGIKVYLITYKEDEWLSKEVKEYRVHSFRFIL